jgi:DNA end-binding protein Ku
MDRIRDKSKGKPIVSEEKEEEEKGGEVIDIMEALRRSLEGGRAPAKRAPAAKRAARPRTRATASKKRKAS